MSSRAGNAREKVGKSSDDDVKPEKEKQLVNSVKQKQKQKQVVGQGTGC